MEHIPNVNLLGVKYLLPMVGGSIDGYYDLKRMAIASNKGGTNLRLSLGTYHPLGTKWVQIYRTKM